ncbi:MAG: SDR family oxidoreductase [Phycisphaerae bacterium]|jgi:pteridine reductase
MNIKGKTAIITGATGKLAEAMVLALAEAGANCVCIYHKNSAQAKKLERKIKSITGNVIARSPDEIETMKQSQLSLKKRDCFAPKGLAVTNSIFIQADLTKPKNIIKVFAHLKKFSTPQILINAAAVFEKKTIKDISSKYIRQTFDINFTASMIMSQKFVEIVRSGKKIKSRGKLVGKIINITDVIVQRPPAGFSIYSASKAALVAATKSLAKELAPDFTVNAVSPGIINWQKGTSAKLKKKILARILAGRTGSPQEIIQAVKFLIENDYITGQIINIDGGATV